MHRYVRGCVATPVTSLCTFVNMCVNVVVVATCACFDLVCRHVCVCLKEHVQSHVYVQLHSCILCVCCVCTCVYRCIHVLCMSINMVLTGYNVLQCYMKMVTMQLCEYILCCSYSNSCAVVTGVTVLCINMDVWHRVKHPAAPARRALYQCSSHALLL